MKIDQKNGIGRLSKKKTNLFLKKYVPPHARVVTIILIILAKLTWMFIINNQCINTYCGI